MVVRHAATITFSGSLHLLAMLEPSAIAAVLSAGTLN
jgi:hypothetical protein